MNANMCSSANSKKYIRWEENNQSLTKLLLKKVIQRNAHLPNDAKELEGRLWDLVNKDFLTILQCFNTRAYTI